MSKSCETAGCGRSPVICIQRADNGQWVRLCARHSMIFEAHPECADDPAIVDQAEASGEWQIVDKLMGGLDEEADKDAVDRILHAWHRSHYPYV